MKYFVEWKEPNTEWKETDRDKTLEIIESNYNNAEDVLRDQEEWAEITGESVIPCMFCLLKITNDLT